MRSTPASYQGDAEAFARYIASLIQDHPEIMTLSSAWDLFDLSYFDRAKCGNISAFQVSWALSRAKELYR